MGIIEFLDLKILTCFKLILEKSFMRIMDTILNNSLIIQ